MITTGIVFVFLGIYFLAGHLLTRVLVHSLWAIATARPFNVHNFTNENFVRCFALWITLFPVIGFGMIAMGYGRRRGKPSYIDRADPGRLQREIRELEEEQARLDKSIQAVKRERGRELA